MLQCINPRVVFLIAALAGASLASSLPAAPLKVRPDFTVEDCGTPLKALRLIASTLYKHPDTGKMHLFCEYGNNNGYGIGEEEWEDRAHRFVDVELESGTMRRTKGALPGSQSTTHWFHPDGKIYLCEFKSGMGGGNFAAYDTRTGSYQRIGCTANSAHSVFLAPSGKIYIGEQQSGDVTVYDPAQRTFLRYCHPGGRVQYMNGMQVEEPLIYCPVTNRGKSSLMVIDTRTGKAAHYFNEEQGQPPASKATPHKYPRTQAGNLFYGAYTLKDGKPLMDARGNPVPLPEPDNSPRSTVGWFPNMWRLTGYGGRLSGIRRGDGDKTGFLFDMENAEANNWNNGIATIRWRKEDEDHWRTIEIKGLEMVPYSMKVLGVAPDGVLCGVGNLYGAVTRFDPKTGKSEKVGDSPGGNCYQILTLKDVTYFCGYTAFFAVYDHSKPYKVDLQQNPPKGQPKPKGLTDVSGDPIDPNKSNPRIYSTGIKWTNNMLLGPDGRVYLGGKDGRHNSGGGFAVFDPKTKQMRRFPFSVLGVRDMVFLGDKKTLAITTTPILLGKPGPKIGSVMLFDITQDKMVREMVLDDLPKAPDEILVAGDNTVLGMSGLVETDEYGNTRHTMSVAGLDLASGKVLFEKRHPGRPFTGICAYDRTPLVPGPDGCGWLFVDEWLCRLLPSGELEKVRKLPEYRGKIIFQGKTMYVFNGGRVLANRFANVVRIPNLFAE
jgi:hypothetical protein